MSDFKYCMSDGVQSKLSGADFCNAPLFYLEKKRVQFLYSFCSPFSLFLIYYRACIISCQPRLSVNLALLFPRSLPECFPSALLSVCEFYPAMPFRCLYENFPNQSSLINMSDGTAFPSRALPPIRSSAGSVPLLQLCAAIFSHDGYTFLDPP